MTGFKMEGCTSSFQADPEPAKPSMFSTNGHAIPALHDYQVQLMLLEQQNKKRLMLARKQQWPEDGFVKRSPSEEVRRETLSHDKSYVPSSPRYNHDKYEHWPRQLETIGYTGEQKATTPSHPNDTTAISRTNTSDSYPTRPYGQPRKDPAPQFSASEGQ
jgi:hypothetical protein